MKFTLKLTSFLSKDLYEIYFEINRVFCLLLIKDDLFSCDIIEVFLSRSTVSFFIFYVLKFNSFYI